MDSLSTASSEVARLCERLQLAPHPEGGFYREHYRGARLGTHSLSTAIFYLMPAGSFSGWHRVRHDELWHHYQGAPLELHTLDEGVGHRVVRLGPVELSNVDDTRPCHVVPAGVWQAARPTSGWALLGNTVAPGFEFADWELIDDTSRRRLCALHPTATMILQQLSR